MDMLWSLTLGARGFFVFLLIRSQVFETFLVMQSVDRNLTLKLMRIYVMVMGFCLGGVTKFSRSTISHTKCLKMTFVIFANEIEGDTFDNFQPLNDLN